jgi:hypothetical protein
MRRLIANAKNRMDALPEWEREMLRRHVAELASIYEDAVSSMNEPEEK